MIEIASTTNPIFRNFPAPFPAAHPSTQTDARMTLAGCMQKTVFLAFCTTAVSVWIWHTLCQSASAGSIAPLGERFLLILLAVSALAPFILVGLSLWCRTLSPFTAPAYAVLQGAFFGFFSFAFERSFPGVAMQVFCLTFAVCISYAIAYYYGLIRVTDRFNKKVLLGLAGAVFYFAVVLLLRAAGLKFLPMAFRGRGVLLCGVIVIIAVVTFISEFDLTAKSAQQNHPACMEWHAALGFTVSFVWLYLEGLRIFFKNRVPNEVAGKESTKA